MVPRWLIGVAALTLVGTGAVALTTNRETGPATQQEDEFSQPSERTAIAASCRSVVTQLVGRLGQAPKIPEGATPTKQVRAIGTEVERIRGIAFTKRLSPSFVSRDELSRRIGASVEEGYPRESSDSDTRVLVALGAVPRGSDVGELVRETLSEQVIGFYDAGTGIVVGTSDPKALLSPLARMTLAHELDHALTDQVLGLPDIIEKADPGQEDTSLAALAVVEGDATLVMQLYAFTSLSLDEQAQIKEDPAIAGPETESEDLPPYLQSALEFPYLAGLGFVCDLYLSGGGWPAVDGAYKQPPSSSAQVMFPDRYRAGEAPVDPPDNGSLAEPWKMARTYALGAADLLWLFEAPGGKRVEGLSRPSARASAWAGGELVLWTREADTALGISLAERAGKSGLCVSMRDWYRRSFPKDTSVRRSADESLAIDGTSQDAVIRCRGKQVRMGVAPDLATARALVR